MAICGLQQSTHEAEEALSRGLDALNRSLSETISSESLIVSPNMSTYMGQMALAINKLSTLEGFVRQVNRSPNILLQNSVMCTIRFARRYRYNYHNTLSPTVLM